MYSIRYSYLYLIQTDRKGSYIYTKISIIPDIPGAMAPRSHSLHTGYASLGSSTYSNLVYTSLASMEINLLIS